MRGKNEKIEITSVMVRACRKSTAAVARLIPAVSRRKLERRAY